MVPESRLDEFWGRLNEFFSRHWKRLLLLRDRLRMSEEAFHILIAAVIGLIGGGTNFAYHVCNQVMKWLVLGRTDDLPEIAKGLVAWQRVLVPTLGAMAAGMVLFLGLRLIGNPGLSNLLEVVVAGDGRLRARGHALRHGDVAGIRARLALVRAAGCASARRRPGLHFVPRATDESGVGGAVSARRSRGSKSTPNNERIRRLVRHRM